MNRNKMMISRILDYITVDRCVVKTRIRYYINNGHLSIITDYSRIPKDDIEHIDMTNKELKDKLRKGSKDRRIAISCGMQHIKIKEFTGFTDKSRPHIKPIHDCIKINEWFNGSHAHHITKSIIIYIPKELHGHIRHNLRTGHNMGEINALSIQFVNGGL